MGRAAKRSPLRSNSIRPAALLSVPDAGRWRPRRVAPAVIAKCEMSSKAKTAGPIQSLNAGESRGLMISAAAGAWVAATASMPPNGTRSASRSEITVPVASIKEPPCRRTQAGRINSPLRKGAMEATRKAQENTPYMPGRRRRCLGNRPRQRIVRNHMAAANNPANAPSAPSADGVSTCCQCMAVGIPSNVRTKNQISAAHTLAAMIIRRKRTPELRVVAAITRPRVRGSETVAGPARTIETGDGRRVRRDVP